MSWFSRVAAGTFAAAVMMAATGNVAAETGAGVTAAGAVAQSVRLAQAAPAQSAAPQQQQPVTDSQSADDSIGSVSSVQGNATVTRGTATSALKVDDDIFKGDVLQTGRDGALGITFDDETTFNLTANARLVVDNFVYEKDGKKNSALFTVTRGTAAFVAAQVAKTGDMKIATPSATMGIRGTTGVVEVPENAGEAGSPDQARIKLYPDSDGRVGRIEVFNPTGARLGILSNAQRAFAIRPGGPLRFSAVPFQISAQEMARDRATVQRLFAVHTLGRQKIFQRLQQRQLRQPGLRQNLQRPFQQQRQPFQQRQPLQQPLQQRPLQQPLQRQPLQQPQRQPLQQQLQRQPLQQPLQRQPLQQQQQQRPSLLQRLPGLFQRAPALQRQPQQQQQPQQGQQRPLLRRQPQDQDQPSPR